MKGFQGIESMMDVHALARDVVNAVLARAFDPRTETVTREAIEDRRSEIERLVGCTIAERYARIQGGTKR